MDKPTTVVNVRLPIDEAERLMEMAKTHGITRTSIIQQLVKKCRVEMRPVVMVGDEYEVTA